ncbi:hypothetical protein M0811_02293 [Anaeramoeba ignava]|uniref:Uncharacterized protein n=1 Tax=Anaeramoeba ignava TaxID=1746090 RepID=A0A9Q0R7P5_ANAIG|nr:hypothetical protein M0811_02293 [Anaeramoeba ignava]
MSIIIDILIRNPNPILIFLAPLMNSFERKNWQESTDQMYSNSIEPQSNVESYQVYSPSFDSKNPQFKKDQKN